MTWAAISRITCAVSTWDDVPAMTSPPLELPVKADEARRLAELVFDLAESRTLDENARKRIAGRIPALRLTSMEPSAGSLARDPIHPSTYYMLAGEQLLRIALASSPSSGLFPNSILIGRLRTQSGLEVVVNSIAFSPRDHRNIRAFAAQVDTAFLPRLGANLPGMAARPEDAADRWHSTIWHAIRAGWRDGWVAMLRLDSVEQAEAARHLFDDFTVFSAAGDFEAIHDVIREARSRKAFEFETVGGSSVPGPVGRRPGGRVNYRVLREPEEIGESKGS